MTIRPNTETWLATSIATVLIALSPVAFAQVPVDDDGNVIGSFESPAPAATGNEDIPLLSTVDLEELVGPIALYPDDLLAIVLPAAAYPLQIIDAARFLEALESDPALKPDPDWDDSVVALLNYPEVVELLNDDIDWTWQLGEAVVSQQADVVAAIETFRDRAYAAGNLKSDSYQNVTHDEGVIEITPVSEDVIYVPYYEPERVVVYQPRPVYYYYPHAYPVYYYPYPSSYYFDNGPFWGVTTAFRIGWFSDSLSVFHHSYYGHPYFGRSYYSPWWYRRPTINIHNTTYVGYDTQVTINRYYGGDRWRPRHIRRGSLDDVRIARTRSFPRHTRQRQVGGVDSQRDGSLSRESRSSWTENRSGNDRITFRERPSRFKAKRADVSKDRRDASRAPARSSSTADKQRRETATQRRDVVQFRDRSGTAKVANNQTGRKDPKSWSASNQPRTERDWSNGSRRVKTERRMPDRVSRQAQSSPARTSHKAPVETRRAVPKVRASQPVKLARRAETVPRAEAPRQPSRPQVTQKAERRNSNAVSKRQAEPRRSESRSIGKFAAREKQRD